MKAGVTRVTGLVNYRLSDHSRLVQRNTVAMWGGIQLPGVGNYLLHV